MTATGDPTTVTDPADLTLTEAARLIRSRAMTSTELVTAILARAAATEGAVHAFTTIDPEGALAAARAADRRRPVGPLHGVPFGVKDTLHALGTRTEAGSASLAGRMSTFDATAVRRLRAAGGIVIGKQVTHEFAQGFDLPPTRNPWADDRFPGGSSAGSGASVAVGSSTIALGTDAGGSTRMPAALTGVVGFKPTYGEISTYGTVTGAAVPGLEHIGIFTRCIDDVRLVLAATRGADDEDPRTLWAPTPQRKDVSLRGLRVGVVHRLSPTQRVDDRVVEAVTLAASRLSDCTVDTERLDLDLPHAEAAHSLLVAAAGSASHLEVLRGGGQGLDPEVARHLRAGLLIPARLVSAAQAARTSLRRRVADLFRSRRLDALLMPTIPTAFPRRDEFRPAQDMGPLTSFTSPWNLTGQPAVSLPVGLDLEQLPVSVQLVGRPYEEASLLALAAALERQSDHPFHRPHALEASHV